RKALTFIDLEIRDEHRKLLERKADLEKDQLSSMAIHYFYARSFFPDVAVDSEAKMAYDFFSRQAEQYWLNKGIYQEGMLALALQRMDKKATAQDIVKSLKERSLNNEELGMYWKYNTGYYWYQLPIETHALMIEVFAEVAQDEQAVNDLKVWLLKNKQTTHWKTTKATASAVYALLMNGDNWLLENNPVKIILGDDTTGDPEIASYTSQIQDAQQTAEAGTGYFRTEWNGSEVNPSMANIRVENTNKSIAWGAAYWQYFEELDKIKTFKETPLTLDKQLFLQKDTDRGPQIEPVTENTKLVAGDLLKVRIELRVDRAMEYVHLKDMRASGFEPVNVMSQYKYQDGLGYYESTRDVATNFFIGYLPQGTYVFEYPLRVAHAGDFSNGITTIQSMYAPEFTSHSEGIRVRVE
ncbi:MAG: alpha-2-macroglobulin, partial [Saprospiraceae bacterium]